MTNSGSNNFIFEITRDGLENSAFFNGNLNALVHALPDSLESYNSGFKLIRKYGNSGL